MILRLRGETEPIGDETATCSKTPIRCSLQNSPGGPRHGTAWGPTPQSSARCERREQATTLLGDVRRADRARPLYQLSGLPMVDVSIRARRVVDADQSRLKVTQKY